ncbi:MAG: dipeptidyl-peptidase 5 [Acidobacteriota bacterium]
MTKIVAPYGSWTSSLSAARVTAGALRFDHLVLDGDDLYWVEGRASDAGRYVVVRRTPDGRISDVTPTGFSVRTQVHEYGGAAYTVARGTIYFANFTDQGLYRVSGLGEPERLTSDDRRYADCQVDAPRSRLICVREDHAAVGRPAAAAGTPAARGPRADEPVNEIVAVSLAQGLTLDARVAREKVLITGADFYASPALSPDGTRLAWLEWHHPNMPWDGTELWVAMVNVDGSLGVRTLVAGSATESIFQPSWSPDGLLYFVSDRTGWWNLYRTGAPGATGAGDAGKASGAGGAAGAASVPGAAGTIEALYPMSAEFGRPLWTFGKPTYAFITPTRMAVTYTEGGRWRMALVETEPRKFEPIDLRLQPTDGVVATTRDVFFIGGSATDPPAVACMNLATIEAEVLRRSTTDQLDASWLSVAQPITFPSEDESVHAFYYAPHNPNFAASETERPPLLVLNHGGPTSAAPDVLDPRIQFWTSRGFAVLDINYRGSTGYGRDYRDSLKGQWGLADVADSVNGAKHLASQGLADADRLVIRGGSAGGYTTLAALTFHETFKAGASYYGISDVEVLARDTHKFESRYLDSLIGPYPAARDVYRQRSPIHFADRLSAALILFQGLEDKVVPPNQSEMMAAAARKKGLPVAYVTFEGEQHGFRKAETIIRCLESELYFYGAVLGFSPADAVEPVAIDNLATLRLGPSS